MSNRRKEDPPGGRRRFRSERLIQDQGKWYFCTREGTCEGPYSDKLKALEGLESYITVAQLQFVERDSQTGFALALPPTLH